jgi:hypothetical protein
VLYELTSLRPPFDAFNIRGLVDKICRNAAPPLPAEYTDEWKDIIKRCAAAGGQPALWPGGWPAAQEGEGGRGAGRGGAAAGGRQLQVRRLICPRHLAGDAAPAPARLSLPPG